MKLTTRSLSILKGTNKCITSSEDNVSSLREGTYLRINNDNIFYTVLSTKSIFLIKDFVLILPNKIKIKDLGYHVYLKGDTITISFKEKELLSVFSIINAGAKYKAGDQINLLGGDVSFNIEDNTTFPTKFIVNEADPKGGIISFGILEHGRYINAPNRECEVIGGEGTGAIFECEFRLLDNRSVLERTIERIDCEGDGTVLTLNYSLPPAIKEGKLSFKKSEIILTTDYKNNSQIDVSYEVSRDFTPYLGLALIVKNSLSQEMLINNSLVKLDNKLREIDDKIKELKTFNELKT